MNTTQTNEYQLKKLKYFLRKIFLYLLIAICIPCCNQNKGRVVYSDPVFPVDIEVEFEMIIEDPVIPDLIRDMDFYKGKLALLYELNNRFIHFFDAETGEESGSFLNKGNGPGEVIYPGCFRLDQKTGTFTVFDIMTRQFFSGQIDSLYKGIELTSIKEDFSTATYVFPLPQGYFIFQSPLISAPERRYLLRNWNGEEVDYEGYPYDDFRLAHKLFVTHVLGFSKDGKKMVAAASPGTILEIFDIKKEIKKTHTRYFWRLYGEFIGNQFRSDFDKSGVGIVDFYCTNKYIYATLGEPNTDKRYENIAIFDWKGKPVKILRTKYYRLYQICLDDEERFLYVVGEKNDGILFLAKLDLSKY